MSDASPQGFQPASAPFFGYRDKIAKDNKKKRETGLELALSDNAKP